VWLLRLICIFLTSIAVGHAAVLKPTRVATNVYAFIGDSGEVTTANRGRIGNAGFIVGPEGIVVVDTGISYRHGREMVAAIRKVSKRPIRLAIITHAHQEFLMGASYFQTIKVPILTHAKTAQLMESRCENCLHHLKEILGEASMRGTKVVTPDRILDGSEFVSIAGMTLELHHFGWGNTPGDLVVFDRNSGVVFAGGVVDVDRVPELRDARLKEWEIILEKLATLPIKRLVPGHGAVGDAMAIDNFAIYLRSINRKVRELYDQGVSLSDVEAHGDLPGFTTWSLYAEQHHKNVHRAYLEIEREDLEQ
jgi:glyoxylase-like metal-dependent hydrolase (beta-lactamase superfamily II)